MRGALAAFIVAALAATGLFGAIAFSASEAKERAITMQVVGDGAAYLALFATPGDHACFVREEAATGRLSISFGAGCAAGKGVNAGGAGRFSRYAFDDLVTLQNKGQRALRVWVNATSTTGVVEVASALSPGAMGEGDYASAAPPLLLARTATMLVGVRVNATSAANVSGQITIAARS